MAHHRRRGRRSDRSRARGADPRAGRPEPGPRVLVVRSDVRAGGARRRRQGATRCLRRSVGRGRRPPARRPRCGTAYERARDQRRRTRRRRRDEGRHRAHRRPDRGLGRGGPGVPARRHARRRDRRADRPRRADRGAARPHAPRPPRGLRGGRHGHLQGPPRRGGGRHARRAARREHDQTPPPRRRRDPCRIATGISGPWPRSDGSVRCAASAGFASAGCLRGSSGCSSTSRS